MAQSPPQIDSGDSLEDYLKNWDALSSMLTRGRSFSGRERNCSFLNLGSSNGSLNRFADISAVSGLDLIDDGRAVLASDWDQDGDLDLWQTNREGPRLRFLRNNLGVRQRQQWIAFELVGATVNRDAIGAILTVKTGNKTITRTLAAGDGFMSQSGKRLHFGLGRETSSTVSVTVRWPGGSPETIEGLQPGQAYKVLQGSRKAEIIERKKNNLVETSSTPVVPPSTEKARIILTHRIASPPLQFVDFSGQLQKHEPGKTGSPVLINLWASWCPNCQQELDEFRSRYQELEKKGLGVLALTVEGVSRDGKRPDITGAKDLVARSNFPFQVGATDQNGLRLLTVLHDRVITRQRPLPLPSSFLIDQSGRLAAIYKGPVSVARILTDLDLLEADAVGLAEEAFPFGGKDGAELFPLGPLDFAQAYLSGGDHEAARREARKLTDAPLTANAEADLAKRARAWYFLGTLEQGLRNWEAAAKAYQSALDFSPDQFLMKIPLGVSFWQSGEMEEARKAFEEAAEAGAKSAQTMNALGKGHLQIKQYPDAIRFFERAIALAPDQMSHRYALALAHQAAGNHPKAVTLYRTLLAADPQSINIKNNLSLILSSSPDSSVRNGQEALKLAKEVLTRSGESHPSPLDSLGAALAETGEFTGAIAATQKALKLARAIGRNDLVPKLQKKLALYRLNEAYRSDR